MATRPQADGRLHPVRDDLGGSPGSHRPVAMRRAEEMDVFQHGTLMEFPGVEWMVFRGPVPKKVEFPGRSPPEESRVYGIMCRTLGVPFQVF